jgi:hypothetical protein
MRFRMKEQNDILALSGLQLNKWWFQLKRIERNVDVRYWRFYTKNKAVFNKILVPRKKGA